MEARALWTLVAAAVASLMPACRQHPPAPLREARALAPAADPSRVVFPPGSPQLEQIRVAPVETVIAAVGEVTAPAGWRPIRAGSRACSCR